MMILSLIPIILLQEHREEISSSHAKNKMSMKAEIASAAASLEAELPHRPNFGCQVVVQSGEEKELQKLARKEEKKINKLLNKAGFIFGHMVS